MSDVATDFTAFFDTGDVSPAIVAELADKVFETHVAWERFDTLTRERAAQGASALQLGIAQYLLGRYRDALEHLAKAAEGPTRRIYAARAATALSQYDEALAQLDAAEKAGRDAFENDMQRIEVLVRLERFDDAQQLVEKHTRGGEDRADWYTAFGRLAEARGERERAAELYEKALQLDAEHEAALFRAAWLSDLRGDDDEAIEHYRKLAEKPGARVNALVNLSVIYEDIGRFSEAMRCLRRVLATHPNHTRARLFLKDVESSRQMVIDETADERADARTRLLDAPIGEFELSVRARNCLKKMNIHTLGQLVQLSEQELLAYKNFGEASLTEIKQLLARKGLRLGQRPDEIDPEQVPAEEPEAPRIEVPPGREAVLAKPITELELSVRSRRCLQRLNVQTMGDLLQYSEADLLAARNFGVTSLNEIKGKLSEFGLSLVGKQGE